jgi:hypothetical protein
MDLVKEYPNGFRVYTTGTENPWRVVRGAFIASVWSWAEVERIVNVG